MDVNEQQAERRQVMADGPTTRFDAWEQMAVAWLDGKAAEPPEPLTTKETLGLLRLCKRAYAIEHSVTQGHERELRYRYGEFLDEVLDIRRSTDGE